MGDRIILQILTLVRIQTPILKSPRADRCETVSIPQPQSSEIPEYIVWWPT